MLSPTYEITTALSHTDELISPPYDIAIVTISYGRVTMSSVWDSMMSKKNMGWPFYAAVQNKQYHRSLSYGSAEGPTTWAWWRHQMETFPALLALCAGNSSVTGEFPSQWPVTRNFDVFFHLRQNKRLSEQSWGWRFETPSHPLWRHRNEVCKTIFAVSPN